MDFPKESQDMQWFRLRIYPLAALAVLVAVYVSRQPALLAAPPPFAASTSVPGITLAPGPQPKAGTSLALPSAAPQSGANGTVGYRIKLPPVFVPPQKPGTKPPIPRFTWSMVPSYASGWASYNSKTRRYSPAYVEPSRYGLNFNACKSSGNGVRVTTYHWHFEGISVRNFDRRVTTHNCQLTPRPGGIFGFFPSLGRISAPYFPARGTYRVTLSVEDQDGRVSKTLTHVIHVRDVLIVSLGDSYASGEGDPDTSSSRRWQDKPCHRSMISGPARAARAIEKADPHASVTFISFACSGAEVKGLLQGDKQEPRGQIRELQDLLCRAHRLRAGPKAACRPDDLRRIDALFLSVGGNDVGFSHIIKHCAGVDNDWRAVANSTTGGIFEKACEPGDNKPIITSVDTKIFQLPGKYHSLDQAIQNNFDVSQTYITEYPSDPFDDHSGCGVLVGIHAQVAQFLAQEGSLLDEFVERGAVRNKWNYVGGIARKFRGHGYCADKHWFNQVHESQGIQGDTDGTMHPNHEGSVAIGQQLANAYVAPKPKKTPTTRVQITFTSVRVEYHFVNPILHRPDNAPLRVTLSYDSKRDVLGGYKVHTFSVMAPPGHTVRFNSGHRTFSTEVAPGYLDTIEVSAETKVPGTIGTNYTIIPKLKRVPGTETTNSEREATAEASRRDTLHLRRLYSHAAQYGTGAHDEKTTIRQDDASLEVTYTIHVQRIGIPTYRIQGSFYRSTRKTP